MSSTTPQSPAFTIPLAILLCILSALVGSILTAWLGQSPPPLAIVDDQTAVDVPVIRIEGIRNSALVGQITGDVRLVAGDEPVMPDASGSFTIRDTSILTNVITVRAPEGMRFVASKRGKKYYPIDSAAGQNIVPENRVYFKDEGSAERAGYRK